MYIDKSEVSKNLTCIWNILDNKNLMHDISLENIRELAESKGLIVTDLREVNFCYNFNIKAVLLKSSDGAILLPRKRVKDIEGYENKVKSVMNVKRYWKSVDWFIPAYINNGKLHKILKSTGTLPKDIAHYEALKLQELFDGALPQLYDLSTIIPITLQILPNSEVFNKHLPIIKEAILAFYSGMKVAAIASLIPIIEDIIKSIIGEVNRDSDTITNVNNCIDIACRNVFSMDSHYVDWLPNEYCENEFLTATNNRILILETIRDWLINSFYANDIKYSNFSGFNRHHFAHSLSDIWQKESNFFRAIGLIQALAFTACFAVENIGISIFMPSYDENSKSFHLEILACLKLQAYKKLAIATIQSREGLPHISTASDDGWLLRATILREKMNTEIIESLKNKGWQCYNFQDPEEEGEYIIIDARKDHREIKIALLYSCATEKDVYIKLEETCDYILFQGAAYKIEEFTRGLKNNVQPLSAWIVPD